MRAFAAELQSHDVNARVINDIAGSGVVRLEVYQGEDTDFIYEVHCRAHALPLEGVPEKALEELPDTDKFYRAEVHLFQGGQDYDIMGWTRDQVSHDMLWQYEHHLQFLHSMR
jgi:choline/glycine/proline betaine transport protein